MCCCLLGTHFAFGPFPAKFVLFLQKQLKKSFAEIRDFAGLQVEMLLGKTIYTPATSHVSFKKNSPTLSISHVFAKAFLINPVILPILKHLKNLLASNEHDWKHLEKGKDKKKRNLVHVCFFTCFSVSWFS